MEGVFLLNGVVKHYEWGGYSFLPALLGRSNAARKPWAEFWVGTHAQGSAQLHTPEATLDLLHCTGPLPYLLKVLDVRDMLSIQVHPKRIDAQRDFERENADGIPLDAPHRNYKDPNHKPELMVALNDFWLLHGFKPEADLANMLRRVPALSELLPVFEASGYQGLYRHIMRLPQTDVNRILGSLIRGISKKYKQGWLDRDQEDFWAARASVTFARGGDLDRGIFSIYFFNLLHLRKGEAIFQDAGVPHAYLEGRNVEIMANSDNVLRGGLTVKHIDVDELLRHVVCAATRPQILRPAMVPGRLQSYPVPVSDFKLESILLDDGMSHAHTTAGYEIWLAIEGAACLCYEDKQLHLAPGHPVALSGPGTVMNIRAKGPCWIFRACRG